MREAPANRARRTAERAGDLSEVYQAAQNTEWADQHKCDRNTILFRLRLRSVSDLGVLPQQCKAESERACAKVGHETAARDVRRAGTPGAPAPPHDRPRLARRGVHRRLLAPE